jgi:hypothetical protein
MTVLHPQGQLVDAAADWADAYSRMWDMADDFHGSLNLAEIAPLSKMLALAGRPDLAAIMLREWAIIENAEGALDDDRREELAELVAGLPTIPDHRNEGDFDWTPYITPEEEEDA